MRRKRERDKVEGCVSRSLLRFAPIVSCFLSLKPLSLSPHLSQEQPGRTQVLVYADELVDLEGGHEREARGGRERPASSCCSRHRRRRRKINAGGRRKKVKFFFFSSSAATAFAAHISSFFPSLLPALLLPEPRKPNASRPLSIKSSRSTLALGSLVARSKEKRRLVLKQFVSFDGRPGQSNLKRIASVLHPLSRFPCFLASKHHPSHFLRPRID